MNLRFGPSFEIIFSFNVQKRHVRIFYNDKIILNRNKDQNDIYDISKISPILRGDVQGLKRAVQGNSKSHVRYTRIKVYRACKLQPLCANSVISCLISHGHVSANNSNATSFSIDSKFPSFLLGGGFVR